MANKLTTVGDPIKARTIVEADLDRGIQAYLDDFQLPIVELGAGYTLDLDAAVERHRFAREMLYRPGSTPTACHNAVRTAMLLAVPKKA